MYQHHLVHSGQRRTGEINIMYADLQTFGTMNLNTANAELKENLRVVKLQSEALLHSMDLMAMRITFEDGEVEKWIEARKALSEIRTLEVNAGLAQTIMLSEDNLKKLKLTYGATTDAAINKIINDLIVQGESDAKKKQKESKLKKQLDKITPMCQ